MAVLRPIATALIFSVISACSAEAAPQDDSVVMTSSPSFDLPPLDVPSNDPRSRLSSIEAMEATEAPEAEDEPPRADKDDSPRAPPRPRSAPTELDDLDIADLRTDAPTTKEWLAVDPVRTQALACRARLVREWISITCSLRLNTWNEPMGLLRVVAGDPTDVSTWSYTNEKVAAVIGGPEVTAAAVFPLRRGDRRLMELGYVSHGAKFAFADAFTISEVWLEGMPSPEISVTGL